MHELSVALELVDVILDEMGRLGAVRVASAHVRIGPLSGVVAEALAPAFDLATAATPLEGIRLEVTEEPITAWCDPCREVRTLPDVWTRVCSHCGRVLPDLLTGAGLELTSLEVEDAPPDR